MIMNVVLMPLNQIIGSCGERNLIALDFNYFWPAALQLWPPVAVSIASMRNARRRISQAPRSAERDLDDTIYLACAVDGYAHLLTAEDSDLRLLGESYGNVQIVSWRELKAELSRLGLVN